MINPKRGQTYTLKQIEEELFLRDSPCLLFVHEDVEGVIQDSHIGENISKIVPLAGESQWVYIRETDEWIPVFKFDTKVEQRPVTDFLDLTPDTDHDGKPSWWATPKGFPCSKD